MPAVQTADVGPKFDILISTRDGSTLPCRDSNGVTQNLSQVAYMTSTQKQQQEGTEIQRKDRLTQLSSAQVIDREFDAWPQVQQGDWSDGAGQRVFSGQGEALGTVSNRSTKYWDGYGLLWPIADYVPQRGFTPPTFSDSGSSMVPISNVAGGGLTTAGFTPGAGFAFMYAIGATITLVYIGGFVSPGGTRLTLTNPNDVVTSTGAFLVSGHGAMWYVTAAGTILVDYVVQNPVGTLVATRFTSIGAGGVGSNGLLTCGRVGNRAYVAVPFNTAANNGLGVTFTIRLFDITFTNKAGAQSAFPSNSSVDIDLPGNHWLTDIAFVGDNLLIATTDLTNAYIHAFNIPGQTTSTAARIQNSTEALLTEVGGGVFILAANAVTPGQKTVDLYLLQGQSLQHIGPLSQGAYFKGVAKPQTQGPYAIFPAQDLSNFLQIFAYDSLRGRLFRIGRVAVASDWGNFWDNPQSTNYGGSALAMLPGMNRGSHGGNPSNFLGQWGVAVNVQGASGSTLNLQEFWFGVQPQGTTQVVRTGCDLTSSLIDFTSAQNKLYRQVVTSFTALGTNAASSVTLNIWLDKDPLDITSQSLAPDFTSTIAGSVPNQNVTQLAVLVNKIARKLVYEVIVQPFQFVAGAFLSAPKLQSVAVQASTGWAWHIFLDLAKSTLTNSGTSYCFAEQVNGVDELSAYNFIRQLWRLKGGQFLVTLPNGDSYNAQMQMENSGSPKPFGAAWAQSGQTYQQMMEFRFREDV